MPTKQEMITKIYEVIADKTLSFGCLIRHEKVALRWNCIVLWWWYPVKTHVYACYKRSMDDIMSDVWVPKDGLEIIWHPVMIGDVLDWMYENKIECNVVPEVYDTFWEAIGNRTLLVGRTLWLNSRLPIDQQSEECIKYVYDLLPTT